MSKIETIIFDFDGTIVDSFEFMSVHFKTISKRLGEKELSLYEVKALKNDTLENLAKKYQLWKVLIMAVWIQSKMLRNAADIKIHVGLKSVIEELARDRYRLCIFSNNSATVIRKILEYHNLQDSFEVIVGRRNLSSKTKSLAKFITKYKIDPNTAIYVGDEVKDIIAAKANGVRIISVSWGFNSSVKLKEYQPDWLAVKSSQISRIINRKA
jgi:phosphoglycolate phosphatase